MKRTFWAALILATSACSNPNGPTLAGGGPACANAAIAQMRPDERAAFVLGLDAARTAHPELTETTFFVQQAELYKMTQEGDPRLWTWFYGETLATYDECISR